MPMSDQEQNSSATPEEQSAAFAEAMGRAMAEINELAEDRRRGRPKKSARVVVILWLCTVAVVYGYYRFVWEPPPGEGTVAPVSESAEAPAERVDPETSASAVRWPFRIVTEPDNASVRLLGWADPYRGGMLLPAGQYQVEVSAPGYVSEQFLIRHDSGPTARRIALAPSAESASAADRPLNLRVRPSNATVRFIATGEVYEQGAPLQPGQYELFVSASGYRSQTLTVTHGAGVAAVRSAA